MSTTPPLPPPPAPATTYNQKMLAQIRAVLAGKALDDVASYKVGGRELIHYTWPELMKLEASYERRVRNEIRRSKGLGQRFVPIIFGSAEDSWRVRLADTFREVGLIPMLGLGCWLAFRWVFPKRRAR